MMRGVLEANDNPHNLRAGVSSTYDLSYSGNECTVAIGESTFTHSDMVDGMIMAGRMNWSRRHGQDGAAETTPLTGQLELGVG
jgi:hypothetical protein